MQTRRNLELKARCSDLAAAATAAVALGANAAGVLIQTDTYFRVPNGRLKLREHNGGRAELIWYARPDQVEFRASDYQVAPVSHPAEIMDTLERAMGIRGVVRKRRELYLWQNVRIHLDDVQSLGTFVEFEAVINLGESDTENLERLRILAEALRIREQDRIAQSYSDLLGL